MKRRVGRLLAALAVSALAIGTGAPAQGVGTEGVGTEGVDVDPMSKVASDVRMMVERVEEASEAGTDPATLSTGLLRASGDGDVQVTVHSEEPITAKQRQRLRSLGATGVRTLIHRPSPVVTAWLPAENLREVASQPWVAAITAPRYTRFSPHPANGANTEGVPIHNADELHARNITGAGVKVGVVSDGVSNLAAAQAANELPAVTVLDLGTGDEGTAMLEIVHDMAPGASLYFHAAGEEQIDLINALDALADAGVNVIVHDVGVLSDPVFQRGLVAASVDDIVQSGVAVHAAAGNEGDTHAPRVPAVGTGAGPEGATGPFNNCGTSPTNAVAIAPGTASPTTFDVNLSGGTEATFLLQWSEPAVVFPTQGAGGFTDLDVYLMDTSLTNCLAKSDAAQADGVGDTLEAFSYTAPADGPAKLVVGVNGTSSAVAAPTLDLTFVEADAVDPPSRAGSLAPSGNFTSGLANNIAAVGPPSAQVEPFSSGGPIQLFSTTTCPPGPGGAIPPGPCTGAAGPPAQTFQGLAWSGVDGVSVSGAGGFQTQFFGTSAAAPHSAACDALVRQAIALPASPPKPVNDRLAAAAVDQAPTGTDEVTGAGVLDCQAAARVSNITTALSADPTTAPVGTTVTFTLTLTNNGPDASPPVTAEVDLPAGVTFAASGNPCAAAAATTGQTVSCDFPALANGASQTFTFTATVGSDAATGGVPATARLTGTAVVFDASPGDNSAIVTLQVPDGTTPTTTTITTTTTTTPTTLPDTVSTVPGSSTTFVTTPVIQPASQTNAQATSTTAGTTTTAGGGTTAGGLARTGLAVGAMASLGIILISAGTPLSLRGWLDRRVYRYRR